MVPVARKQKSQAPVDVAKRHKRMEADPDHIYLVRGLVEKVAELENVANVAWEQASRVSKVEHEGPQQLLA